MANPPQLPRCIYEGKLGNRILYLKSLSIFSSVGLAGSYSYVLSQKGITVALAGVGFAFTPFLLSPFVISWFFKRYITKLDYDPNSHTYTAHHYGLLLNKKRCVFRKEDVTRSDVYSMLNTFKVGKKPFFLHDEDLKDTESIMIYKKMVGLDKETNNNKHKLEKYFWNVCQSVANAAESILSKVKLHRLFL